MLEEKDVKWQVWLSGLVCGRTRIRNRVAKIYLPYSSSGYTAWVPSREVNSGLRVLTKKYRKLDDAKKAALRAVNDELERDAARSKKTKKSCK